MRSLHFLVAGAAAPSAVLALVDSRDAPAGGRRLYLLDWRLGHGPRDLRFAFQPDAWLDALAVSSPAATAGAASRIATAGIALAEGVAAGAAGTLRSPLGSPTRDAAAAAARWPVASGGEQRVVSTVGCQTGELAPAPALKAKVKGRRRWLILSCGDPRVEPWNE